MSEPLSPTETAAVAYERVVAQIDALKSHQPGTKAEERRCAVELTRLKQAQNDLARQVIEANAAQQIAEVIGNEYTKPTDAARMNGNGHAPIGQPNWAQVIAETELRCERRIAALEEQHVAKSGGLTDDDLDALAKGIVPFMRNVLIAEAVAPLKARLDELEATQLTDGGTWKPEKVFKPNQLTTYRGAIWICQEPNLNVRPGTSGTWRLMHKTVGNKHDRRDDDR